LTPFLDPFSLNANYVPKVTKVKRSYYESVPLESFFTDFYQHFFVNIYVINPAIIIANHTA
jgi:hypothetical protein